MAKQGTHDLSAVYCPTKLLCLWGTWGHVTGWVVGGIGKQLIPNDGWEPWARRCWTPGEENPVFSKNLKHKSEMGSPTAFWVQMTSFLYSSFWNFLLTKCRSHDPLENINRTEWIKKKTPQDPSPLYPYPMEPNGRKAAFAEDSTVCIKFPSIHLVFLLERALRPHKTEIFWIKPQIPYSSPQRKSLCTLCI